jgi:hypothetical protein
LCDILSEITYFGVVIDPDTYCLVIIFVIYIFNGIYEFIAKNFMFSSDTDRLRRIDLGAPCDVSLNKYLPN